MSTLQKIFDALISGERVQFHGDSKQADNLRTALLRKFKTYREEMDKVGYLDVELRNKTISFSREEDSLVFTLHSKRARKLYAFTVLPLEASEEASHGKDV